MQMMRLIAGLQALWEHSPLAIGFTKTQPHVRDDSLPLHVTANVNRITKSTLSQVELVSPSSAFIIHRIAELRSGRWPLTTDLAWGV